MSQSKTTIGKGNSLLYSLIIAAFLVWQSVEIEITNGQLNARSKEVPIATIVACSSFMAVGLGINILDTLIALKELTNRNAIALNQIKQNLPPSPSVVENEQHKDDETK